MVIEDLGESFVQKPLSKKIKKSSLALALPFDRLAALIADLVLFLPISSLVMAFFKKEMILIQLTGTEVQLHAYLLFYVFVFFILAFLYQSFFLILIGRSPGKYFFGLKILDI